MCLILLRTGLAAFFRRRTPGYSAGVRDDRVQRAGFLGDLVFPGGDRPRLAIVLGTMGGRVFHEA